MGGPRKVVKQDLGLSSEAESVAVAIEAEVISVDKDGKVPVMKGGVTRRIYPGQLAAWRGDGWV